VLLYFFDIILGDFLLFSLALSQCRIKDYKRDEKRKEKEEAERRRAHDVSDPLRPQMPKPSADVTFDEDGEVRQRNDAKWQFTVEETSGYGE
jgi:hypothetical protein